MRLLATIILLAASVSAQITVLPNSGCQNAGNPLIGGQPRIGQSLTIASTQLPCNSPGTSAFVALNVACTTVGVNWSCFSGGNPCNVLAPIDFIGSRPITFSLTLPIPNDPSLIGKSFCVQGGCLATFPSPCLNPLNKAARVTIQP